MFGWIKNFLSYRELVLEFRAIKSRFNYLQFKNQLNSESQLEQGMAQQMAS